MWTILVPLWISGTLSCINRVDIFTKNKLKNNLQTHYDRLPEICLNKTRNKVKINMNYRSNVTKITSYNIEKDVGKKHQSLSTRRTNLFREEEKDN
jgi:hypothetical protein